MPEELDINLLYKAASIVRTWMVDHYGHGVNLAGHCIEASNLLMDILDLLNIESKMQEGWVVYDNDWYCESGFDAHTWVEAETTEGCYYLDVTGDQFNYGMSPGNKFLGITVQIGRPHCISLDLPTIVE